MSFYENTNCPVCGKPFKDDDDIVTCPVCGTPHHRECYENLGKCVNEELHKDGFDYYNSHKTDNQTAINSNTANTQSPQNNNEVIYNPNTSKYNAEQNQANNTNASGQRTQNQAPPTSSTIYTTYDNDPETIDGKPVSEVALSVGVNAQSFIPKFKQLSRKEKKFKFNWCAFFFGPYYMLFRKMYKAGIAFFTANIVTNLLTSAALYRFAPECVGIYNKLLNVQTLTSGNASEQAKQLTESFMNAADLNAFFMIGLISTLIMITINVVAGLITNTLYKNQIIRNIDKIENDIKSGVKTQNMFMYGVGQMPTDEDMKKLMLVKKGSVSFFAPLLAYFALDALNIIIMNLL